jgi:hypothetical protein
VELEGDVYKDAISYLIKDRQNLEVGHSWRFLHSILSCVFLSDTCFKNKTCVMDWFIFIKEKV